MPVTATRTTTTRTTRKASNSKGLGLVMPKPKTVSSKKKNELEEFKAMITKVQKIGSELYDKGLIKPYDPIR